MHTAFLLGVQKVELVGGESWFEHNSVAIAAITAAALAAFVAIVNQRAQLKHDRKMRNRDHIRDTIDNAIDTANRTRTAMRQFLSTLTTAEDQRSEHDVELPPEMVNRLTQLREKTISNIRSMRSAQTRLESRLEEDDSVVDAHKAMLSAFLTVFENTFKGIRANRPSATREEDSQREEELKSAFVGFQNACRDWFADAPGRSWLRLRRDSMPR